jgi:hypothetical protein
MRRKTKAPIDDTPAPWEERPVSRERWRKHRAWLMSGNGAGYRPEEWWLYEKKCQRPKNETQTLYTMGELRGDELAKLLTWWRDAYEEANEVLDVGGSFGTIIRTPEQRQKYLDHHHVPHELVAQWDAERTKDDAA